MDLKIIAVEVNEAKEKGIKTLRDYKRLNPGAVEAVKDWLRDYKTWDGKKQNTFVWGGEILDTDKALEEIAGAHLAYQQLNEDPN